MQTSFWQVSAVFCVLLLPPLVGEASVRALRVVPSVGS